MSYYRSLIQSSSTPTLSFNYKWDFNTLTSVGNTRTIYDTGSLGANLNLVGTAQLSTINSLTSAQYIFNSDSLRVPMNSSANNFLIGQDFMITVVFQRTSNNSEILFASMGIDTFPKRGGFFFEHSQSANRFNIWAINDAGTTWVSIKTYSIPTGTKKIITFARIGGTVKIFDQTTEIHSAGFGQMNYATATNRIYVFGRQGVHPNSTWKNPQWDLDGGNIGYLGINEYNLIKLTDNVNILKTQFGI